MVKMFVKLNFVTDCCILASIAHLKTFIRLKVIFNVL